MIATPVGASTRPTADRARETLFSMLASRLGSFEALTILDMFAGSGALSFEALSRGAAQAFLAESAAPARQAIEANIKALAANARLIAHDVRRLPPAPAPADLVFLDPPYGEGLAAPALLAATDAGWIAPHAWIALETGHAETPELPGFTTDAQRKVGKAMLHLLRPAA